MADPRAADRLRVLIATESPNRLSALAVVIDALGHDVVAREVDVEQVAATTARMQPDIALVGMGDHSEYALLMIDRIAHEVTCPVIVILPAPDPDFAREAARCGVFAFLTDDDEPAAWQSRIEIALRRYGDYRALQDAFSRRATIERAKGILMERHGVDEAAAFVLLREHSRAANRKLIDIAATVVDGHPLLSRHVPRTDQRTV